MSITITPQGEGTLEIKRADVAWPGVMYFDAEETAQLADYFRAIEAKPCIHVWINTIDGVVCDKCGRHFNPNH